MSTDAKALKAAKALLATMQKKCDRLTEARFALPPGSSRARVTTANARWSRAAEARDRLAGLVRELETSR